VIPLQRKADQHSRVHGEITYTRTTTGRPAMRRPNLQNIPIRTEMGKRIRDSFWARPGFKLLSVDYSQIELVILAHESQDPVMLEAFRTGKDVHKLGASRMFDTPYDSVTKEQRSSVKNLNFGIPYGVSAIGLREQFAIRGIVKTDGECQALIDAWFETHAGVRTFMARVHAEAKRFGYVRESIGGGIRWCPGARSELSWIREAALREAGNFPMQGGAASLLEIAMGGIIRDLLPSLWDSGIDIEPLVPVHDELVFEVEEAYASTAALLIANEMKYAADLSVPINVGIAIADRWGDTKSESCSECYWVLNKEHQCTNTVYCNEAVAVA
jgi:DNA polymerase I